MNFFFRFAKLAISSLIHITYIMFTIFTRSTANAHKNEIREFSLCKKEKLWRTAVAHENIMYSFITRAREIASDDANGSFSRSSAPSLHLSTNTRTLRKKFLKNYHTSSKATTDCKNPKNYHTLQ